MHNAKPKDEALAPISSAPLMRPKDIAEFFTILRDANPEPKTELEYTNPFTLVVAVVLSAQMTDTGVNRATKELFKKADNPKAMLKLGEAKVRDYIKSVNFNNAKAKNIIGLSQALLDNHHGEVPRTREELEKLPGVGRKTANVVLNVVYGDPTLAVDTHIFRVSNRTGLAPGKDPLSVELNLEKRVPEEFKPHAHHWIILHGRYICKARTPECWHCPVSKQCRYQSKHLIPPGPKAKKAPKKQ